jgi:GT2 family glycosyltransferase
MAKIKVSVIIVNYNVDQDVFDCIGSIYASKPKSEFEIIVVDNSEVNTIQKKLKENYPSVIYLKQGKNLGFGGGNNLGAKHAKGEYLFFLNPDTKIIGNVVDGLINFIQENTNTGIVAPQILDSSENPHELQGATELTPWKAFLNLSFFSRIFSKLGFKDKYYLRNWDKNGLKNVDVCPGTAFLISRKLFEKIKGFDEKFFLYFEEFDLCKRVRDLNLDIYMNSNFKIIHKWGSSTGKIKESEKNKFFMQSRFYYFKKHFGLLKAILLEIVFKINKYTILLFLAVLLGLFLRLYNLQSGMPFIGDQGWFYISARDLLVNGKIPLVGITSSHLWLHQGPLWTYMLALVLPVFKFSPLAGAYLTILIGALTIVLMYKFGSEMFSVKVGLIAALLYSVSPLIVGLERTPFDPSPIPFFTLLYFYSIYKWISGNKKYFPLIMFFLAILYNLELATFSLVLIFLAIFAYGIIKRKTWLVMLSDKKIIISSIFALVISMLPVLIYDFGNGFKQTIVFVGWVLYKPFSFLLRHSAGSSSINLGSFFNFLLESISKLIFAYNEFIALCIFILGLIYLINRTFKHKELSYSLLLLLTLIGIGGILINFTPSDAYLPMVLPFMIFMIAIVVDYLLIKTRLTYLILIFVLMINSYFSLKFDSKNDLLYRIVACDKIIALTKGEEYNLIGKGANSQFESFTKNYEYLLWWKGHPISSVKQKTKIILEEKSGQILITKNILK